MSVVFYAGQRLRASDLQGLIDDFPKRVKLNDTTRISTATLAADPELTLTLKAGYTYDFTVKVFYGSGSVPDINFAMAFPAGSAITWGGIRIVSGASPTGDMDAGVYTAPTSAVSSIAAAGTGGDTIIKIEGTIVMPVTDGDITLWWTQNTLTASNTTVYKRSTISAVRYR